MRLYMAATIAHLAFKAGQQYEKMADKYEDDN